VTENPADFLILDKTSDYQLSTPMTKLILGVTGGIASGKSTVVNMLRELGVPAIDFDLLARQAVEPGKPALRKIVDYFGEQVLQKNGSLDRKKLSKIVFQNPEKRKNLESFTHPVIYEEYFRQVSKIAEKNPGAIIQAEIPLLFELNLQSMVDKTLLVHIPREKQIKRLTRRNNISEAEAATILNAQMPIDEKLEHADFVVRNENSSDETRKQLESIWQSLKKMQHTNL